MVLNRIRRAFSNNDGSAVPVILILVLVFIIAFMMLFNFFYAVTILNTVRDTSTAAAESALMANAEASYQAKRDGYTGVWHRDAEDISDSGVESIDPGASIAKQLNLVSEGEKLFKMDGQKQIYSIHDIDLVIQNPEFQENDTPLTATLSLVVDINLDFPLVHNRTFSVPIEVSAAWSRKF